MKLSAKRLESPILENQQTDYLSLSDAAKSLKQSPSTIKKRCELKEYPNYLFLTGKV